MTRPAQEHWEEYAKKQLNGCKCDYCDGWWLTSKNEWAVGTHPSRAGKPMIDSDYVCCAGPATITPALYAAALQNKVVTFVSGWTRGPFGDHNIYPPECIQHPEAATPTPQGGCQCKRCNNPNPWANANQSDGTYVCWECRV